MVKQSNYMVLQESKKPLIFLKKQPWHLFKVPPELQHCGEVADVALLLNLLFKIKRSEYSSGKIHLGTSDTIRYCS